MTASPSDVLRLRANGRNNSQQCWKLLLGACWRWCANGCNNSQQCCDLQCIVGRIQPISLCKPCVMSVRGPNNVGRAVQTDPTLLRYASAITEQKNCGSCWVKSLTSFKLCATTRSNIQQHATGCANGRNMHVTSNNIGSCWPTTLRPFARGFRGRVTYPLERLRGRLRTKNAIILIDVAEKPRIQRLF